MMSIVRYRAIAIRLFAAVMLVQVFFAGYSPSQMGIRVGQGQVALQGAGTTGARVAGFKFDVVSIKPTGNAEAYEEKYLPDGFVKTNVPLSRLILMAYFPQVLWAPDRLKNAPPWTSDHYDVIAKVSPEDVAEWQKQSSSMLDNKALQSALQALLKDRCKLVAHMIQAEVAGYDLVIAKRGSRLKLTSPDEVFPPEAAAHPDGWRSGGMLDMETNSAKLTYYNITMDQFVTSFSFTTKTIIQNRTGLTGRYDIVLNDTLPIQGADPELYASMKPTERYDLNAVGLKLQPTMVPTTTLVIDHIERPSPN